MVSDWQEGMNKLDVRNAGAHRLSGWQAIAGYFQRNPSTVRRWATEHGLPIHRPSGTAARKGAAVFAYPEELDDWLRRSNLNSDGSGPAIEAQQAVEPPTPAMPALPKGQTFWKLVGIGGVLFGIVVAGLLLWGPLQGQSRQTAGHPIAQLHPSNEANRELFSDAVYLVETRTPESLSLAMSLLEQLTRNDPQYGAGWSELATVYNLLVEYGQIDAETGYGKSHAMAERALALNPSLAGARAVLADIDFFWFRSIPEGLAHFEQAVSIDPTDAQTLHWYASALALSGEPSRALIEIRKAKYANPSSRTIRVSEGIILLSAGQVDAAGRVLEALIRNEPEYRNPYRFLAFVELARTDYGGYLDAWSRRFELTNDQAGTRVILAGREGLKTGGPDGMMAAMVAAAASAEVQAALEPYFLTHLYALSGDVEKTISALEQIETRHAFYYSIDPAFSGIHQHPEFQDALHRMKLPAI